MRGMGKKETMNVAKYFYNYKVEVNVGGDINEMHEDFNILIE